MNAGLLPDTYIDSLDMEMAQPHHKEMDPQGGSASHLVTIGVGGILHAVLLSEPKIWDSNSDPLNLIIQPRSCEASLTM